MNLRRSATAIRDDPIARLLLILGGVIFLSATLARYPRIAPIVEWAVPTGLVAFGVSRLHRGGTEDRLTQAAGCFLTVGGLTYGAYLLVPMGELAGAVAQSVPALGLVVELFASHYRSGD